jgi:hypothetical protein
LRGQLKDPLDASRRDIIADEVDALVTSGQWSDLAESWRESVTPVLRAAP